MSSTNERLRSRRYGSLIWSAVSIVSALGFVFISPRFFTSQSTVEASMTVNAASVTVASCEQCYDNRNGDAHIFDDAGWYGGILMDCEAYNSCHPNSQPGLCGDSHWTCPEAMILHETLHLAIGEGDATLVARLLAENPHLVEFAAGDGALELRGCDQVEGEVLKLVAPFTAQVATLLNASKA